MRQVNGAFRSMIMLFFVTLFLCFTPACLLAQDNIWLEIDKPDNRLSYVLDDEFFSDILNVRDYWFHMEDFSNQLDIELGLEQDVYKGSFRDNQFSILKYNSNVMVGKLVYKSSYNGRSIYLDSFGMRFTAETRGLLSGGGRSQTDTLKGLLDMHSDLFPDLKLKYSFNRTKTQTEMISGVIQDALHGRTYWGTWTESRGRTNFTLNDGRATASASLTDNNLYVNSRLANKRSYILSYRESNGVYNMNGRHDRNIWNASIQDQLWYGALANLKSHSQNYAEARLVSSSTWQGYYFDSDHRLDWFNGQDSFWAQLKYLRSGDIDEFSTSKDQAADVRNYYAHLNGLTVEGVVRNDVRSFSWTREGHPGTWHAEFLQNGKDRTASIEEEGFSFTGELVHGNQSGLTKLKMDNLTADAQFSRADKSWQGDFDALYRGVHRYHLSGENSNNQERYLFETEKDYVLFTQIDGARQLEFTRGDQLYTWDNDTVKRIMHGDVDLLVNRLHDDCGIQLDFDYTWGEGNANFIRFDDETRTLSMNIDGHDAWVRTSSSEIALSYHSPDGRIGLVGSADDRSTGVHFSEARYADDFMSLDISGVTLEGWDSLNKSIGLYFGDRYLVKLHSAGADELDPLIEDAWDKALSGSLGKEERNSFIRTVVKQIDVNARELAKNHISFQDQRWNDLVTSLAWDVGEFSLNSDQIIQIVDAEDHKEQLYDVLEGILPGTLEKSILDAERQVSLDLGLSLIAEKESVDSLALTGFSGGTQVHYDNALGGNIFSQGGSRGAVSRGYLDVQVPLFGPGSRTMLGFSAPAERMVYRWDDESNGAGALTFSSTGLFYAYHFSGDMFFRLSDGHEQQFSLFHSAPNALAYPLDDDSGTGVIVPGGLWRTRVATPGEFWYANIIAVPYVPLSLGKDLGLSFGRESSSTALAITSLNLATEISTGFNAQLAGHRSHVELAKTINDGFLLSPEFDVLKDHLTVGMDAETRTGNDPSRLNYRADVKWQDFQTRLFMEQNLFSSTRTVGTSLERKFGENTYALSYGVSSWDNTGTWESVETYFVVGFGWRDRIGLMQAVTFNDIDLSTTFRNSAQVYLFKDRSVSVAWDTTLKNLPEGMDVGVGLRTMLQF